MNWPLTLNLLAAAAWLFNAGAFRGKQAPKNLASYMAAWIAVLHLGIAFL